MHTSPSLLSLRSEVHKLQLFLFFLYVRKLKKSGNEGLGWPSLSVMYEMLSALQKTSQLLKYLGLLLFTAMNNLCSWDPELQVMDRQAQRVKLSWINKLPLRPSVQLFRNPAECSCEVNGGT